MTSVFEITMVDVKKARAGKREVHSPSSQGKDL